MARTVFLRRIAIGGLAMLGAAFIGKALWIPAKAALAQHLLERAWQRTLSGRPRVSPWPWADTWPVARLMIRGRTLVVLADSGGEGLAFGPTHVAGSAPPGGAGTTVISAHRDTHFREIGHLQPGEVIAIESGRGRTRRYRVKRWEILETPQMAIPPAEAGDALALVTCWPLDGIFSGTPQRFVLHAAAEDEPMIRR